MHIHCFVPLLGGFRDLICKSSFHFPLLHAEHIALEFQVCSFKTTQCFEGSLNKFFIKINCNNFYDACSVNMHIYLGIFITILPR